jgi:hypothetical protein
MSLKRTLAFVLVYLSLESIVSLSEYNATGTSDCFSGIDHSSASRSIFSDGGVTISFSNSDEFHPLKSDITVDANHSDLIMGINEGYVVDVELSSEGKASEAGKAKGVEYSHSLAVNETSTEWPIEPEEDTGTEEYDTQRNNSDYTSNSNDETDFSEGAVLSDAPVDLLPSAVPEVGSALVESEVPVSIRDARPVSGPIHIPKESIPEIYENSQFSSNSASCLDSAVDARLRRVEKLAVTRPDLIESYNELLLEEMTLMNRINDHLKRAIHARPLFPLNSGDSVRRLIGACQRVVKWIISVFTGPAG